MRAFFLPGMLALAFAVAAPTTVLAQPEALVLSGDPAPGTGGGFFTPPCGQSFCQPFSSLAGNDGGELVFRASVGGGNTPEGIFVVRTSGVVEALAVAGQTAPGTGGGTYEYLGSRPSINSPGDVTFQAHITGGSVSDGIFSVSSVGVTTARVLTGDPAPSTGAGTFSSVGGSPTINDVGDVAFNALVSGGSSDMGIFISRSGGTVEARGLEGDPAPDTGGGIYGGLGNPSINSSGDVVFRGSIDDGAPLISLGIFVIDSAGVHTAKAIKEQVAPGTGAAKYSSFTHTPSINSSGEVAFEASLGPSLDGVFFVHSGGIVVGMGLPGEIAPGTNGGTYGTNSAFQSYVPMNAAGDVTFNATVTGGSAFGGIFVVAASGYGSAAQLAGRPAPGGGTFSSVVAYSISTAGEVGFVASVTGGIAPFGIFVTTPPPQTLPALPIGGLAMLIAALASTAAYRLRTAEPS